MIIRDIGSDLRLCVREHKPSVPSVRGMASQASKESTARPGMADPGMCPSVATIFGTSAAQPLVHFVQGMVPGVTFVSGGT